MSDNPYQRLSALFVPAEPVLYIYPFQRTDEATKLRVWALGRTIANFDSAIWRHDLCGKVMKYSEHGNSGSEHGWEIDHILPRALGGETTWENLEPLNWSTNRFKGDNYPWSCPV